MFSLLCRSSATGPTVAYSTHEAEAWPHFSERTYLHPRVAFGPCQLLAFPHKNAEHVRGVNLIFEQEVAVNGWQCECASDLWNASLCWAHSRLTGSFLSQGGVFTRTGCFWVCREDILQLGNNSQSLCGLPGILKDFLQGLDSVGTFSTVERVSEHSMGFVHILSSVFFRREKQTFI